MNTISIKKIVNEILSTKIVTINDLIEHEFCKIAISVGELIFKTNRRSIKYAKGCVATSKRNDPKNGRWTFRVKCSQGWSKGPYDVRFKLLKSKTKTKGILGREIEISCNCNSWKYNGADYNALDKDYSERQYSNGQPPNIRDPKRKFLICKHIAACVPLFKRFIIPEGFKDDVLPKPLKTLPKQILRKEPEKEIKQQPKKIKPVIPKRIKPIKLR
jgi:hypothetical protein